MADTINDILVTDDEWIDVYTTTGITVGSSVTVNNKGGYNILIQERATKPSDDDDNGKLVGDYTTGTYNATITETPTGIWLKATKGSCDVNVQEI